MEPVSSLRRALQDYARQATAAPARSAGRSVETLVVIVAAIVLAGILARACGGRHVAPTADRDVEAWVDRRCRICLDSGLPPPGASKASEAAK